MSVDRTPAEASDAPTAPPSATMQNARNRIIYEHWQQDRLIEARGILADIAHHPDTLVHLACRVVCTHGSDPVEHADALGVSLLLGRHPSDKANIALIGSAT